MKILSPQPRRAEPSPIIGEPDYSSADEEVVQIAFPAMNSEGRVSPANLNPERVADLNVAQADNEQPSECAKICKLTLLTIGFLIAGTVSILTDNVPTGAGLFFGAFVGLGCIARFSHQEFSRRSY